MFLEKPRAKCVDLISVLLRPPLLPISHSKQTLGRNGLCFCMATLLNDAFDELSFSTRKSSGQLHALSRVSVISPTAVICAQIETRAFLAPLGQPRQTPETPASTKTPLGQLWGLARFRIPTYFHSCPLPTSSPSAQSSRGCSACPGVQGVGVLKGMGLVHLPPAPREVLGR